MSKGKQRPVYVTKSFLPPVDEYIEYVKQIWENNQLTNQGPLLNRFEAEIEEFLGVRNVHFVTNGTIALQLAMRVCDITEGEVITTPFSYVATVSSILWERCEPVFVDIDPDTLCMDPDKIEAAITNRTKAIMPVHVFGIPCDVDKIEAIAKKHSLKVIYDAAHAFGVRYKGKPLLSYGDVAVCSFHATKLFHTIEGGAIFTRDEAAHKALGLMKRFGHYGDEHFMLGINAKSSEFQAAMGLCNLKHADRVIKGRKAVFRKYDSLLKGRVRRPAIRGGTVYNYSYYPVILESEERLMDVTERLKAKNIFPRRYFYPSLNKLPYLEKQQACPVSEDIADRILCLPMYPDLEDEIISKIAEVLIK